MLAAVLEEEVNAFLGRHRYQRGQRFRGYRNGYHPARELTVGLGPVAVRVPRVAQVPRGGSAPGVPLGGSPALPAGVPDHPAAVCPPLPRRAGHGRL